MQQARASDKRFAGKPLLWHGAGMKYRASCLALCFFFLACSTKTAETTDEPFVEDDATNGDGSGGSDGTSGCTSVGCACAVNDDCASKLCGTKGGKQVCVSCIASNGGVEKCDGLDNNCNGVTDESTCPGDGKCLLGACDGATNKCHMEPAPDLSSCEDGNACTVADKCATGNCVGTVATCEDGNPCTSDDCEPATGCVLLPESVTCDDGNACTFADACVQTTCTGTAKDCGDGNPCTDDSCSGGVCLALANTATCDDANACTANDACANKICAGAEGCQDGDPCTLDACDTLGNTCSHTLKPGWQAPLCAGCAPGFAGDNCDTCTDASQTWPNCS